MLDKHGIARGWLSKGDSDLLTVTRLLALSGPFDTACFHAHQAAEKYLKAVLAFAEILIPRTHNLEDLAQMCSTANANWDVGGLDLTVLTPYAVEGRYDLDFWPDEDETREALGIAQAVRNAVVAVLPPNVVPS